MENPNYFAIIPADVRYASIPDGAKLLYGEITALAKSEWFCYAENAYFAGLYKKSTKTISRWISDLKDQNFIEIEINLAEGNQRKIFIKNVSTLSAKMSRGIDKNVSTLGTKMSHHKSTIKNTINIKNNNSSLRSELLQKSQKKSEKNFKNISQSETAEKFVRQSDSVPYMLAEANAKKSNKSTEIKNFSLNFLRLQAEKIENGENPDVLDFVGKDFLGEWQKFLLYWTEPDKNGKIRAVKEKTFEIKRRFFVWISRSSGFSVQPNFTTKNPTPNYGGMYRKPWFDD